MYKIVDKVDGQYKTLFHGVNGSKVLENNKWLKAEVKTVIDGSNGTPYESGWHVLKTVHEAGAYLKNFTSTENKRIVKCKVRKIRKKEHSRNNVYLTDWIFIEGEICETL